MGTLGVKAFLLACQDWYGEAMKQREQNAILKSEVDVARQKQKERQDMLRYCYWTVILSVRSWRTRWSP